MRLLAVTILLLAHCCASYAELGGAPIVRTAPDATGASGTSRVLAVATASAPAGLRTAPITQIETTLPTGTIVNEYVSSAGVVFAVSWKGPVHPDLKELLGPHFTTMVAEVEKSPKAGRSQFTLNRPEVVISAGGHMRAFEGRAWVPAALPAGFTPADIH